MSDAAAFLIASLAFMAFGKRLQAWVCVGAMALLPLVRLLVSLLADR